MPDTIEIDGKRYSKRTVELLSGVKNFYEIDNDLLVIAEAIDNPYDFPFLIEDIYDMDFDEDVRLALIRVQVDSKLNIHKDLEREQLRLYVAESIEKMLFGELLMEGDGKGKDNHNNHKKKHKGKHKHKTSGRGATKHNKKSGKKKNRKSKNSKHPTNGEHNSDDDWGNIYS